MTFYHGSPVGGLNELKPYLSEHEKQYVYFTQNPVVALLYAVHPVPKPFSYYPYGFDKDGTIHYSEYYQNAFSDIYKGKQGYLYECDDIPSAGNPTQINGVFVCENAVKVDRVTMIPDLCDRLMEYQQQGLFRIRPLDTISDKEMQYVYDDLKQTIQKHNLKQFLDNSMSQFIREHFPEVLGGINMKNVIIVCGLNGAGKSTLGKALAKKLNYRFIDMEDIYFPKDDPNYMYSNPRPFEEVERILSNMISENDNFVLASVKGIFNKDIVSHFKCAIYIETPKKTRIKRVYERSYNKFGERMLEGGDLYEKEKAFFDFVKSKDENTVEVWLSSISCPIIRVNGTLPTDVNVTFIANKVAEGVL